MSYILHMGFEMGVFAKSFHTLPSGIKINQFISLCLGWWLEHKSLKSWS